MDGGGRGWRASGKDARSVVRVTSITHKWRPYCHPRGLPPWSREEPLIILHPSRVHPPNLFSRSLVVLYGITRLFPSTFPSLICHPSPASSRENRAPSRGASSSSLVPHNPPPSLPSFVLSLLSPCRLSLTVFFSISPFFLQKTPVRGERELAARSLFFLFEPPARAVPGLLNENLPRPLIRVLATLSPLLLLPSSFLTSSSSSSSSYFLTSPSSSSPPLSLRPPIQDNPPLRVYTTRWQQRLCNAKNTFLEPARFACPLSHPHLVLLLSPYELTPVSHGLQPSARAPGGPPTLRSSPHTRDTLDFSYRLPRGEFRLPLVLSRLQRRAHTHPSPPPPRPREIN